MQQPSFKDDLSAVLRPIETAQGLPNAHYIDPVVYEEEKQALLLSTWAGLAVTADVPEDGDVVPLDFADMPLLLVRDHNGDVRVFQNTCRHRGMILVDKPGKIEGALRCPYHSWCYGLDGRLVATPHVGGPGQNIHQAIDRATLGLIEIRSHIWRDVVWINVSGDAPGFEHAMADAIKHWQEFDQPMFHGGADSRFQLALKTNWKLAVENYCESYHLPWVHPGLNSYSRLEDHYHLEKNGEYSGQGTRVYRQLKAEDGSVFPDFSDLSEKWQKGAEYPAIYPNVLFGIQRDHAYAIILLPQGPEKVVEHVHIYYPTPDTDPDLRAANTSQWRGVFEEDITVVEGMQRGRHGILFDGGRFSPVMDGPTHCFHTWVGRKVAAHRSSAP